MYKLFVFFALIAVAAARPGYLHTSPVVYSAPTYVHEPVGSIVSSIPTAVSHQSLSQVHSSAHYVQPIVAPVLKTTYAAPVVKTFATPIVHTSYAAVSPLYHSYSAAPVLKSYAPTYAGSYSQW